MMINMGNNRGGELSVSGEGHFEVQALLDISKYCHSLKLRNRVFLSVCSFNLLSTRDSINSSN